MWRVTCIVHEQSSRSSKVSIGQAAQDLVRVVALPQSHLTQVRRHESTAALIVHTWHLPPAAAATAHPGSTSLPR